MKYFKAERDFIVLRRTGEGHFEELLFPNGSLWTQGELRRRIPGVDPNSITVFVVVELGRGGAYRDRGGIRYACENYGG